METPQWLADLVAAHPRHVLRWEDPPYNPTTRGRRSWPEVEPPCPATRNPDSRHAAELRARPYRWGCVFEGGHNRAADVATGIRNGGYGFKVGFRSTSRRLVGGGYGTYARYEPPRLT